MPAKSDISRRIRTTLAEYLKRDPSTIAPSHTLGDDLGLDSMATIELLFKIEEIFDLQIPDHDLPRLLRVADVIAYVEEKLVASTPSGTTGRTKRSSTKKKG